MKLQKCKNVNLQKLDHTLKIPKMRHVADFIFASLPFCFLQIYSFTLIILEKTYSEKYNCKNAKMRDVPISNFRFSCLHTWVSQKRDVHSEVSPGCPDKSDAVGICLRLAKPCFRTYSNFCICFIQHSRS